VGLPRDPAVRTDDLRVVESGGHLKIVAGDRPVVTLVEADAELERVNLRALADVYRNRIARAIEEYRTARTPEHLLQSALRTLVATVALVLAIDLVLWLARRIDTLVELVIGVILLGQPIPATTDDTWAFYYNAHQSCEGMPRVAGGSSSGSASRVTPISSTGRWCTQPPRPWRGSTGLD
jgi:hypothetical protein